MPWLEVVRLGHRIDRDKRITSHLGLTARALGADGIVLCGDEDPSIIETWNNVSDEAKDFISKILVADPDTRLNCEQMMQHPWMELELPNM